MPGTADPLSTATWVCWAAASAPALRGLAFGFGLGLGFAGATAGAWLRARAGAGAGAAAGAAEAPPKLSLSLLGARTNATRPAPTNSAVTTATSSPRRPRDRLWAGRAVARAGAHGGAATGATAPGRAYALR